MSEISEQELNPLNREVLNEVWVDATPDGEYALRILRAYRERCSVRWLIGGMPEDRIAFYSAMNESQRQRAEELDEAIRFLERRRAFLAEQAARREREEYAPDGGK